MGGWKDEEQIKAELRVLTSQLKQLREELQELVSPPKASPSRAFLHRKGWPTEGPEERDSADDRSPKPPSAAGPLKKR
jgi:hypothetical protein